MKKNITNTKWFEQVLQALGGEEQEEAETLRNLLNYIARSKRWGECWEEAVLLNGSHIPKLNPGATKAILSMTNVNACQAHQLRKGFLIELGGTILSSELSMDLSYKKP